jgi:arylsulfatase A-like enzyme
MTQLIRTLAFALLAALAPAGFAVPARPNIIVILADDVGFSDLGCYGSEIHTPNLDALAQGGLRFTQFYNTARCCPSRAALLTGLYSHQTGVGHMTENHDLDGYVGDLNEHCVTIPQVLKPSGYATYMLGKLHVTKHTKPEGPKDNWPLQRGFDHYYGTILGAGNYFDPGALVRDNTMISAFADPDYKAEPGTYYYTEALAANACRYIEQQHREHAEQPFFMYVAFTSAHWPMHAPQRDIAKYKGVYDAGYEPIRRARFERERKLGLIEPGWELSPQFGEWDKVKDKAWEARCMEVYAAMLDNMDQGIGRIVQTLKQTGQFDNTLILYTQDNGGNLEDVGRQGAEKRADHPTLPPIPLDHVNLSGRPKQTRDGWPVLSGTGVLPGPRDTFIAYGKGWANVSNVPFREYKHYVHEGGIATPLIAHWPKGITRRGELERQPGHLIDIMATCVELSGAEYPKQFDGHEITPMEGHSLLPAFAGKPIDRDAIYWEHEGNRAVRQGDWKLVAKAPAGKWELYNLATDRTEMHDLSSSETQRAADLRARWEAWARRAHVLPWPWKPQYGQKDAEAEVNGAAHVVLKLKAGDDLPGKKAPPIVGRTIKIAAEIRKPGAEGVIIAHGGTAVGYSLYVKDRRLQFATRHEGEMTVVSADEPLADDVKSVGATLAADGTVMLTADGKTIATGKTPGLLTKTPKDGLQVGRDANGAVGEYATPFPFGGEIGEVTVESTVGK